MTTRCPWLRERRRWRNPRRRRAPLRPAPAPPRAAAPPSDSDDELPLADRAAAVATKPARPPAAPPSDSDDELPLGDRARALATARDADRAAAARAAKRAAKRAAELTAKKAAAKVAKKARKAEGGDRPARRRTPPRAAGAGRAVARPSNAAAKWTTLSHAGVLFPPEYLPHGVRMKYKGVPVDLTPEQEEVATMYASMLDTDYAQKERFNANFWAAFKGVLGSGHAIRSLEGCDFTPIADHVAAEREKKRAASREDKAAAKAERDAIEAKHKHALVDGRKEQVGNFRVEPPGLFRGRGDHPRMGALKRRVYPRDVTINIGRGEPIPGHPYPGQRWNEVRHDNTVTWLAFWKDPVQPKEYKYVWLAANSKFKADSDLAKYEKARALKGRVDAIRAKYTRDWHSPDAQTRQMAVALYFIDRLALRAGHEKDTDEEADTVGCCNLKVGDIDVVSPTSIRFDFLGKDSIRYENTVDVEARVAALVTEFRARTADQSRTKTGGDQLFDAMDATDLNVALKDAMPDLSAKVFRTYNASVTLHALLSDVTLGPSDNVDEKKAAYDRANKEVAVLCNHQRSVPCGHAAAAEKLAARITALEAEAREAAERANGARGGDKAAATAAALQRKRDALAKARLAAAVKDDLKTVALGTSKINYMDPRITIAWCKRAGTPIERVFNRSLLSKFHWAMDVEPGFEF